MTSNERKILECIRNHGREAHVRAVSDACGLTSDYTRFLCKSLARSGYLKFAEKSNQYFDMPIFVFEQIEDKNRYDSDMLIYIQHICR